MYVKSVEVDSNTLSSRKVVQIGNNEITTPAKVVQSEKLRGPEQLSHLARGVVEIYSTTNASKLDSHNERVKLARSLKRQWRTAGDSEAVFNYIGYNDSTDLDIDHAKELIIIQSNFGDVLSVPLMNHLVDAANDGDGLDSPQVRSIIQNVETYLQAINELGLEKPVFGMIPCISVECTLALLKIYLEEGLRGFCVDFQRRSPIAKSQLDHVITPLMSTLEEYDILDKSVVYAINAVYSRSVRGEDRRKPDALFAISSGFDILGENHISPKWPKGVFEKLQKQIEEEGIYLNLLDIENLSVVPVRPQDLDEFLPLEVNMPIDRVRERIHKDPQERFRLANLINTELLSLYLNSKGGIHPSEIYNGLENSEYSYDEEFNRIHELVKELDDE